MNKSKKALVLEDKEAISDLIRFYLEEEGFQVITAFSAEGFVEKAMEFQPDLITMEIALCDGDGLEILKTLLESERTRRIPVVVISVEELDSQMFKERIAGYIRKPFSEKEFQNTIRSILAETHNEKNTHR